MTSKILAQSATAPNSGTPVPLRQEAPATRLMKIAGGGHVAYDDTENDGPLILAIPGMGDLRSEYRRLRPALLRAGYRVVTMDVRGFGETSADWDDYSAHAVGRDALALIAHLGADSAIVLGNSFAAGAALWAAHDAPARVSAVGLLGPIVRDIEVPWYAALALKAGFAGPWRVGFWMAYWNTLFPLGKAPDHAEVKAAIRRNLQEPGRMDALRTMLTISKKDTEAILARSRVRALIVMGTADPDFKDASKEAGWLATQLKADTMLVDGAGHYPHVEAAEEVASRLDAFVKVGEKPVRRTTRVTSLLQARG